MRPRDSHESAPYSWEENTERRVGILESKVDKILDPENGIYPMLRRIEARQTRNANRVLTSSVLVLVGVVVNLIATHVK